MSESSQVGRQIGRNESCPCGSGKKYKRCCGKDAAPVLTNAAEATSEQSPSRSAPKGTPKGTMTGLGKIAAMNPVWLFKVSRAIKRLPKPQMEQLKSLITQAMAGKDVNRELEVLRRSLPPEVRDLLDNAPKDVEEAIENDPSLAQGQPKVKKPGFFSRVFKKKDSGTTT